MNDDFNPAFTVIMSGGQTGADIAGWDAALEKTDTKPVFPHFGFVPKGARNEAGSIDPKYNFMEMASSDYADRTEANVKYAHGTVVFYKRVMGRGSELTVALCAKHLRPCLKIDLNDPVDPVILLNWIRTNRVFYLNVAGSRESKCPGIYRAVKDFMVEVLTLLNKG